MQILEAIPQTFLRNFSAKHEDLRKYCVSYAEKKFCKIGSQSVFIIIDG